MDEILAVVAKAPIAGFSKTRLECELGPEQTQTLYEAFMQDFFSKAFKHFSCPHIFYTPVEQQEFFKNLLIGKSFNLFPQVELPFFERLKKLFSCFDKDDFIHLTGSDIPDFPFEYILGEKKENTVYLGPDEDGGYYYIGTQAKNSVVFDIDLKDGDVNVFPATKEIVKKNNLNLVELPMWSDIDTLDDLKKFSERNSKKNLKTMKLLQGINFS